MLGFNKLSVGMVVTAVTCLVLVSTVTASIRTPSVWPSGHGVYVGAAAPDDVVEFERWGGAQVGCIADFLSSDNWDDISNPVWWITRWTASSASHHLVLSVPLLPNSGADLRTGAEGRYDQYFRTLATLLVREGFPDTTIRLGWEFNDGTFPWAVHPGGGPNGTASSDDFIRYWRHVVSAMRSVAGSRFTFDWTVNNGYSVVPAEQAYPGDGFVDIVGIDAYDQVWGPNGAQVADPPQRWRSISNGLHNLNWWAAFARRHRKAVGLPEWGVISGGHGGGDNPYYVNQMLTWSKENHVVYEIYFDSGQSRISSGAFPNAAAAYIASTSHQ
jgi:hypothetical protein